MDYMAQLRKEAKAAERANLYLPSSMYSDGKILICWIEDSATEDRMLRSKEWSGYVNQVIVSGYVNIGPNNEVLDAVWLDEGIPNSVKIPVTMSKKDWNEIVVPARDEQGHTVMMLSGFEKRSWVRKKDSPRKGGKKKGEVDTYNHHATVTGAPESAMEKMFLAQFD